MQKFIFLKFQILYRKDLQRLYNHVKLELFLRYSLRVDFIWLKSRFAKFTSAIYRVDCNTNSNSCVGTSIPTIL